MDHPYVLLWSYQPTSLTCLPNVLFVQWSEGSSVCAQGTTGRGQFGHFVESA